MRLRMTSERVLPVLGIVLLAALALAGCGGESPAPRSASYVDEVMADSPRAYWRFGESSGTTAVSATETNAGSYVNGVELGQRGAIRGDSNTAVSLDGVNDTVRVPSSTSLSATSALSLEAWINPSSLPSDTTATIMRKGGEYLLRLHPSGGVTFRLSKEGAANELSTPDNPISAGRWSHVVATWDGAAMTVYVNGSRRASAVLRGRLDRTADALHHGSSYGSYDWFAGKLDEPAIYGSALSAARVQAHYAASGATGSRPTVSLKAPAGGSTMDATPTFGGSGGTESGDSPTVAVKVYSGRAVTGTPLQTLTAAVEVAGTFSVKASSRLPSGTYTARAEQSTSAGAIGRSAPTTFTVDASSAPVLVAAGDIAACNTFGDEATAKLLDALPGTVAPLGDLVYEYATEYDFDYCYDPTWGRHKARTRPGVGGHEYLTRDAAPYYKYFGAAAGDPSKGYYSYDLGAWHIVSLNDTCSEIGGCGAGSPQEQWLRSDLAANSKRCTLAYLHTPRFSSGSLHGSETAVQALWQALYDHGADVMLSGHDHIYERFAPQTPTGRLDRARGIRQFVVGTGGRSHYGIGEPAPHSEVRNNDTFGVIKLTLGAAGYSWRFVPEAAKTFTDSGRDVCR